jgi:pimeloyl-ACP methyl ester carboxylesterase
MWRPQLERVPEGWRLIAPHLRGFGRGPAPRGASSMDAFAADLARFMDAIGEERAVIAGLSMGGYIALALMRVAPARFSGLVLANTRALADTEAARRGRQEMSALVRSSGPSAVADRMLPKLLSEAAREDDPALVEHVRSMIEDNSTAGIDAAIHAMMNRPDSTPLLSRVPVPALVIAGEADAIVPVSEAEAMRREIPRSHLVVLPGTGHLSNLEAPDEFSLALADFLSSNL